MYKYVIFASCTIAKIFIMTLGVTSIDTTGVEVLFEIQKNMDAKKMKVKH